MKYVLFADIHFGNKSNSDNFNQECLDFLTFMQNWCDDTIQEDYETIFLGDWFHNRNAINVKTLNYGKEGLVILSNLGNRQYMLIGNHDLYMKNSRDTYSIIIPEDAEGIEIIDNPICKDGLLFVPWLLDEEKLKDLITEYSPEYVFGHFEIPSFKYNQKIAMEGDYNPFDYQGPKMIFSGHFHMRQAKDNITYIGNCFSHDFSDDNNWNNKGFAVFDSETGDIQYVEWKEAPKYLVVRVSDMNIPDDMSNGYLRIINDKNYDNSQILKLQEELKKTGFFKEIQIIPPELDLTGDIDSIEMKDIGNMNVIIPEMLAKVDMEGIDNNKLIDIYNNLNVA